MKKKLLLLTHEFPPYMGGVSSYAYEMAKEASLIYDVTVLVPNYDGDNNDDRKEIFKIIRYDGYQYSIKRFFKIVYLLLKYKELIKKHDIVHTIDFAFLIGMSFCKKYRLLDKEFVSTVYGTELLTLHSSLHLKFLNIKDIFDYPSTIFAISEYTKKLLFKKSLKNIDKNKVFTTYLGVSNYWFSELKTEENIISKIKLETTNHIIITVARLDERKGHMTVLESLKLLEKKLDNIVYIIAGPISDKIYYDKLQTKVGKLERAKVIFTGAITRDEIKYLYKVAKVFCMPGIQNNEKVEGFGLVYLEASAQKLPSIASDIGAVSEIVKDGYNGFIIKNSDYTTLSKRLEILLTNKGLREEMGKNAFQNAQKYTWIETINKSYQNV